MKLALFLLFIGAVFTGLAIYNIGKAELDAALQGGTAALLLSGEISHLTTKILKREK